METKLNQYYITIFWNDSPQYTILFPFKNFKQAMNTAQKIVFKSGIRWSYAVIKPKYSLL